jgi:hypothetical protein
MPTVSCLLLDEVDFGLRICQKVALYFVLEFRLVLGAKLQTITAIDIRQILPVLTRNLSISCLV